MAEWEHLAVVTVWIRVRILVGSHVEYGFLVLLVAWASVLFASSEGYMCDWHGPAKSPMSASFFPHLLRKQTHGSGPCCSAMLTIAQSCLCVNRPPSQIWIDESNVHETNSHAVVQSKFLSRQQRKSIAAAAQVAPLQRVISLLCHLHRCDNDVSSMAIHLLQRDMTPFSTLHELLAKLCAHHALSTGCNQSLHMPGQTTSISQWCNKQQNINYNLFCMRWINGFLRGCSMGQKKTSFCAWATSGRCLPLPDR